jgi:ATP-dependent Lon protease
MLNDSSQLELDFFAPQDAAEDDANAVAAADDFAEGPEQATDSPSAAEPADTVAVFDPADLDSLHNAEASVGKELQLRNKRLIEELRSCGPRRQFLLQDQALQNLEALRTEMPHFGEVIDELSDQVALAHTARRPLRAQPLLLLGPPGVGKSHFCNQLADALGLPTYRLAMDNAQGSSQLAGSASFWSNSQTGLVFKALALGPHISPLMVLDEIDKAPRQSQYDPLASLHGLLEPSTAQHFQDASFALRLDARFVLWMATANSVSELDAPLRSRFSVHAIPAPTPEQARRIAASVAREALAQSGLALEISPELLDRLAQRTPRQQRQGVVRALGRAVRAGRRVVLAEDLPAGPAAEPPRRAIGFVPA